MHSARRQAWRYLQASILGTLVNFVARFPLTELVGFGASVILANYIGMALVFLLSYKRAFKVEAASWPITARFVLVAHIGLVSTWIVSVAALALMRLVLPESFDPQAAELLLHRLGLDITSFFPAVWVPQLVQGFCHGCGIVAGFGVNFFGHRLYSFRIKK